jgi:hypothetical protein
VVAHYWGRANFRDQIPGDSSSIQISCSSLEEKHPWNDSDRAKIHASAIKKSPPNETVAITRTTSRIQIADRTSAVGTNPRRDRTLCGTTKRSVRTSNLLGLRRLTAVISPSGPFVPKI